jgi:hypothetical protein
MILQLDAITQEVGFVIAPRRLFISPMSSKLVSTVKSEDSEMNIGMRQY